MVERGTLYGQVCHAMMKNSKERLQYLYTSGDLSDVDIFFPDDEDPIKAHRLILSMSSPVFRGMLMGPLASGKELTFPKDSRQTFQKLLDHMYLDQMDLESVEEALEVYALTHKYQMDQAMKDCVQYIVSNVEAETMLAVFETSVVYEDAVLNNKCKEILSRDPDAVMLSETVSCVSKESLRDLLADDTLAFSSETVPFRGLIAWGKAQLGQGHEDPSGSALREKIWDLVREVRFLSMSCDEFVDKVVDTNVLTHTECIHILRAIRGADPSTLPRTTPLHPAKGRKGRRPPPKEGIASFHPSPGGRTATMQPPTRYGLINRLSSDRNICVHRVDAPGAGTVLIRKSDGLKVVSSTTCEGGEFVFEPPATLESGKEYVVMFTPKTPVVVNVPTGGGSRRVDDVTLSYKGCVECCLYFREPESFGST